MSETLFLLMSDGRTLTVTDDPIEDVFRRTGDLSFVRWFSARDDSGQSVSVNPKFIARAWFGTETATRIEERVA